MDKIEIIIEKAGLIIKNAKESKAFFFDIISVEKFISFTVQVLLNDLKNLGIYKVSCKNTFEPSM